MARCGFGFGILCFLRGFDGLVGGLSGGLEYIGVLIAMIDLVVVVVWDLDVDVGGSLKIH